MRYTFIFFLFFSTISCNQKTFGTQEELLTYLQNEENGYLHKNTIHGIDISVMYRPTDLLVFQELGDTITVGKIEELRNKYNKHLYFNLSFSHSNQELLSVLPKDRNEFGQLVNRLAFGMEGTMYLLSSKKDTLQMVDYIYPRLYGMSNATSMMAVFPREDKALSGDFFHFIIQDFGLSTGELRFKFLLSLLNDEPKIKFKPST